MDIWILRPIGETDSSDSPWNPWYDKSFGFIIRAHDSESARLLASKQSGDESRSGYGNPWLDKAFSICERLSYNGDAEVIMMDFHSA